MEKSAKEKLLNKNLTDAIAHFETESKRHKRMYRIIRYIIYGLTGSAAVLAGASLSFKFYSDWFSFGVIIATALTGVATSYEGLRKPSALWRHEKNILYDLIDLEREIDFKTEDHTIPLENVEESFDKLQKILAKSKSDWSNITKNPSGSGEKQQG